MANSVEIFEVSAAIKSPADKFYNFIKYDISDLVTIFPSGYTGAELLEGEQGAVGSVMLWNYVDGGVPLSMKVKTEEVNDEGKFITLTALEGDVMLVYKSIKITITVTDGFVKWTFAFEKTSPLAPILELYGPLVIIASNLVDAYLLLKK